MSVFATVALETSGTVSWIFGAPSTSGAISNARQKSMPRQHDSSQDRTGGSCHCPHNRGVWLHWPFQFLDQFPASSAQQADRRSRVQQTFHLAACYLDIRKHTWIRVVVSL